MSIFLTAAQITGTKTGAAALALGDGNKGTVSRFRVQVVLASTGSLTFRGVVSGSGLAVQTYGVALAYAVVGSTSATAGSTAITASGIYDIDASGLDVWVDISANATGVSIYFEPLIG